MSRTIDKSKKSNIKCEHCKYFDKDHTQIIFVVNHTEIRNTCMITTEPKNYWNRCKCFDWR